jgi:hypothetical protein
MKISGLIVILDEGLMEKGVDRIIEAVRMIKGVENVQVVENKTSEDMAKCQGRLDVIGDLNCLINKYKKI